MLRHEKELMVKITSIGRFLDHLNSKTLALSVFSMAVFAQSVFTLQRMICINQLLLLDKKKLYLCGICAL